MYEKMEQLEAPSADAVLWRYMSFTKFVSLLTENALFFARADKLGDPFEGSLSPINVALRPEMYKGRPEEQQKLIGEFIRYLRRFTLVNCWHENRNESDAMWKLYSGIEDGIAIKTDFHSLSQSLTCTQPIYIGRVTYINYEKTFVPEMETLAPFVHKRKSFEHEREVRAIAVETLDYTVEWGVLDRPALYDVGTYFEVDTSVLIKEVVVPPLAGDWFVDLVEATARSFKLKAPTRRSALAAPPTWT